MKISLKWLNDYLDIKLSNLELSDKLTELGLEATYKRIGKTFEGIVVGKVLSCKSHPNADKLSVCEVDIGNDIKSNIVCGAPNVKKNIYVPVAKIGAKLDNGKFKIKKAKLRGVVSEGMICSGKELGYNDDHNGILILKKEVQLGIPIEDVINFNDDIVFDLDLTPNRGDCLGHLGVAREIGIIQKTMVKQKHANINENHEDISNNIRVAIEAVEGCSRYTGRIIKGVKVGPSPYWLKSRLESVGIKSINNIVDAANYVLMDTGHPMHTFDLDKIDDNKIHVRYALDGEEINFLDGSKKQLKEFHLVIADDKKSLALAGIMGSENSGITNETKNIFIESAYFDPKIIRKGAKSLDLSTDASHRFERDTDIDNLIPSLNQLAEIINKIILP